MGGKRSGISKSCAREMMNERKLCNWVVISRDDQLSFSSSLNFYPCFGRTLIVWVRLFFHLSYQFTFNYHFFTHFLWCSMLNRQLHKIFFFAAALQWRESDSKWTKKRQTDGDYTMIVCKLVDFFVMDKMLYILSRETNCMWLNCVEKKMKTIYTRDWARARSRISGDFLEWWQSFVKVEQVKWLGGAMTSCFEVNSSIETSVLHRFAIDERHRRVQHVTNYEQKFPMSMSIRWKFADFYKHFFSAIFAAMLFLLMQIPALIIISQTHNLFSSYN
jgi:hypothetical protein